MKSVLVPLLLLSIPAAAELSPQLPYRGGYECSTTFSADGHHLAISAREVTVFDLRTWKVGRTFGGFQRQLGCSLNRDGSLLAVGDYPHRLKVFRTATGSLAWSFQGPQPQYAGGYEALFSPKEDRLLCYAGTHGRGHLDPVVRLFVGSTGKVVRNWQGWMPAEGQPSEFAWAANGECFVRGRDRTVESYSGRDGTRLSTQRLPGDFIHFQDRSGEMWIRRDGPKKDDPVVEAHYSLPGLLPLKEVVGMDTDGPVHPESKLTWKQTDEKLTITDHDGTAVYQSTGPAELHRWLPGGGFVVAAKALECYDKQGKFLGRVPSLAYGPAKSTLVFDQVGYGGPCGLYDLRTGKKLGSFSFAAGPDWSDDDRWLALVLKKGVVVLDIRQTLEQQKLVLRK